ncbi:MAG: tRNA-binding protein [Chloroflexi bacterium]|nr:tRNA-binding protein [Chloroflexota bacterium]MCC6892988.1 tRNA-binding protein [Anaerolineae bacterium]
METNNATAPIEFDDFMKVDMRVGTVLTCELNPKAKKPAYILTIDFGELGVKTSSAQVTQNYTTEDLVGKQVVAVVNFPVKRIAGIVSEVLVLGAYSAAQDVVLLQPTLTVENGSRVG